jgi:hypothetical protein
VNIFAATSFEHFFVHYLLRLSIQLLFNSTHRNWQFSEPARDLFSLSISYLSVKLYFSTFCKTFSFKILFSCEHFCKLYTTNLHEHLYEHSFKMSTLQRRFVILYSGSFSHSKQQWTLSVKLYYCIFRKHFRLKIIVGHSVQCMRSSHLFSWVHFVNIFENSMQQTCMNIFPNIHSNVYSATKKHWMSTTREHFCKHLFNSLLNLSTA